MLHRLKMIEICQKEVPEYALLLWQSYGNPSNLLHGIKVISLERGVRQGDPLGCL